MNNRNNLEVDVTKAQQLSLDVRRIYIYFFFQLCLIGPSILISSLWKSKSPAYLRSFYMYV